jgi:hypothetical protein
LTSSYEAKVTIYNCRIIGAIRSPAGIAPGLMPGAGGGRTGREGPGSGLGEGQDHAVSGWQPGRRNDDRPCGQRTLMVDGVVVPGWTRFAGAAGRHR